MGTRVQRRAYGLFGLLVFAGAILVPLAHIAASSSGHAHLTADGLVVHTHAPSVVRQEHTVRKDTGRPDTASIAVFGDLHSLISVLDSNVPTDGVVEELITINADAEVSLLATRVLVFERARAPPNV